MKLLLDTHIFLWLNADDPRLTKKARKRIDEAQEVFVSSVVFWELAIKIRRGDLTADLEELRSALYSNAFTILPITVEHACAAATLPWHHKDPFDRMMVAQAITEPLRLMTADHQLEPYSDLIIRV
ncbi:MAG: type II toxin-antitoxin system VapC family toxin [Holophaga sp.]|nr:type II toxin-antitoxin system VapC family toxin [Holophaga sp.]